MKFPQPPRKQSPKRKITAGLCSPSAPPSCALWKTPPKKPRSAAAAPTLNPGKSEAAIFLYPGKPLRVVNQLLTNFHLPQSSLLALVATLAGQENILRAYQHAVAAEYRFYSYGDCMLIR